MLPKHWSNDIDVVAVFLSAPRCCFGRLEDPTAQAYVPRANGMSCLDASTYRSIA